MKKSVTIFSLIVIIILSILFVLKATVFEIDSISIILYLVSLQMLLIVIIVNWWEERD